MKLKVLSAVAFAGFALIGQTLAAPITITTPAVDPGDLIRAEDWNRIRVDLESLAVGLDVITNQSWLPNGSDVYFNLGNVGIGTVTPSASLQILKNSPLPNTNLLLVGTNTDNNRFAVEEDGDVSADGNILIRGGNVYDSDGNLNVSGEENLYLVADWDNDAVDTSAIIFGKNNPGAGANFVELMRLSEQGVLGLGTSAPFANWSAVPSAGIELSGPGAQLAISESGGDRWAWQFGAHGLELYNDATDVAPIVLNSNGQIGIGQTAPQRDLHVGGFARFDLGMESNIWCNQSGSGCISQVLVQNLLASGNGPQECPSGFIMVGGNGRDNTFCVESDERVATDFWNAKNICRGLTDSTLGMAHLCTAREWYDACATSSGNALTGNSEWIDDFDATPEALAMGQSVCESVASLDVGTNQAYRCCY